MVILGTFSIHILGVSGALGAGKGFVPPLFIHMAEAQEDWGH
jgi:hypothetical protein